MSDPSTDAAVSVLVSSQTVSAPRPESCHKPAFPWERLTAFIDPDDGLSVTRNGRMAESTNGGRHGGQLRTGSPRHART